MSIPTGFEEKKRVPGKGGLKNKIKSRATSQCSNKRVTISQSSNKKTAQTIMISKLGDHTEQSQCQRLTQ
jgi:hypothetical protein